MSVGDKDEFMCPKCRRKFQESDRYPDREGDGDEVTVMCPECSFEMGAMFHMEWWYEQDDIAFAKDYLKLRGFKKEPQSWVAVGAYFGRFLDGNKTENSCWAGNHWDEAFRIVTEYFDKPVEEAKP